MEEPGGQTSGTIMQSAPADGIRASSKGNTRNLSNIKMFVTYIAKDIVKIIYVVKDVNTLNGFLIITFSVSLQE